MPESEPTVAEKFNALIWAEMKNGQAEMIEFVRGTPEPEPENGAA